MTRDEMLERITSEELTAWMALFAIHAREHQRSHDIAESGDGVVIESGRDDDLELDEEEPEDDGD